MGKRLWPQYKGLTDTWGLETKIPRDSGPPQTDRQTDRTWGGVTVLETFHKSLHSFTPTLERCVSITRPKNAARFTLVRKQCYNSPCETKINEY
jgi:hypothetical protein